MTKHHFSTLLLAVRYALAKHAADPVARAVAEDVVTHIAAAMCDGKHFDKTFFLNCAGVEIKEPTQ